VVKTNVERIGGTVDVQSTRGRGTTVRVKIPLTLAIIPALVVTCGGDRYAIPQVSLLELVRLAPEQAGGGIEMVHGAPVHRLRGRLLPLVYLERELNAAAIREQAAGHPSAPASEGEALFRSVALAYGANVLAVVMTGMGSDGVLGAQQIREAGGEVIIQDEASAVVWGMPGLVYAAGQADGVYSLDQLAAEITRRVLQSRVPRKVLLGNNLAVAELRGK